MSNDKKRVLDVGQCAPDHAAIRHFAESMGAQVTQVALPSEAITILEKESFDLVLVNRKIDRDYSDGMELVRMMRNGNGKTKVPVMLISNFAEAQEQAVQEGAVPGFGKSELGSARARELLQKYL